MNRASIVKHLAPLLLILLLPGCVSLPPTSPEPPLRNAWEKAGEVEIKRRFWNWFFQPSREVRRELLFGEARRRARELYGVEAEILVEELRGSWHPLSLAMGADLLGFVEEGDLKASVGVPAPPPPPAAKPPVEQPRKITYRYPVHPAAPYDSRREYTRVEFKSRLMMEQELRELQERGEVSGEDMEERIAELSPGGAVCVSLGRSEIENAISKWFTFTLTKGDEVLFSRRGEEDIPYVPGSDKLWWNDLVLPVRSAEEPPFELEISDRFQDKVYRFTIFKMHF